MFRHPFLGQWFWTPVWWVDRLAWLLSQPFALCFIGFIALYWLSTVSINRIDARGRIQWFWVFSLDEHVLFFYRLDYWLSCFLSVLLVSPVHFFDLMSACVRQNGQNQTTTWMVTNSPEIAPHVRHLGMHQNSLSTKKGCFCTHTNVSKALVNTVNHLQFDHKWLV